MSKEKQIASAEKLIREKKYDKALKEYQKILAAQAKDVRVQLKIAELFIKLKKVPQAIETYRQIGEAYTQENFHLKAVAVYKTILRLNPTASDINLKLGDLYRQIGLNQDAVNQYYIVAGYYDNKGMTQEAMEVRQKISEIDPDNITVRVRLAEMLQLEGKSDEALREYSRAAELLQEKGNEEGLADTYEKILFLRPENKKMLLHLCQIYFKKKEFKKILKKMESAPAESKEDVEMTLLWCEACVEDRQLDAARQKFRGLFEKVLAAKRTDLIARVKSRILQEFSDDEEYLREVEELEKTQRGAAQKVAPQHREDFEKTEIFEFDAVPPKK